MKEFNPTEYYTLAEFLSKIDCEGAKRSAISRYYYSIFLLSRSYLVTCNRFIPSGNSQDHERIKNELTNSSNENERILGNAMNKLREYRNLADYELNYDIKKNETIIEEWIEEAWTNLQIIRSYPPKIKI